MWIISLSGYLEIIQTSHKAVIWILNRFLTLLKCVFWIKFPCTAFIDIMHHGFFIIFQHPGKIWAGCPNASCHSPCPARLLPSFLRSSYLVTSGFIFTKKMMNCLKCFFKYLKLRPHHKGLAPVYERYWKITSVFFDLYLLVVWDSNPGIPFSIIFSHEDFCRCTKSGSSADISDIRRGRPTCCEWSGPLRNISETSMEKVSTGLARHWQWGNHVAQYFA